MRAIKIISLFAISLLVGCSVTSGNNRQEVAESLSDDDRCAHIDPQEDPRGKLKCVEEWAQLLEQELERKQALLGRRRGFLTSKTKDPVDAKYLRSWVRQVQMFGNIQYPEEARREKIRGYVILRARVDADGSLIKAEVRKSSGNPVLDKAAVDAVKVAAPFDPFPEKMRKAYDEVDIIQVFNYLSRDYNSNSK